MEVPEWYDELLNLDNYELPIEIVCQRCEDTTLQVTKEKLEKHTRSGLLPELRLEILMRKFGWRRPARLNLCGTCYHEASSDEIKNMDSPLPHD